MIVPGARLLLLLLAGGVPFAAAAGLFPALLPWALLFGAGLIAAAAVDALLGWTRLEGFSVEPAETARLTQGAEGKAVLRIRKPKGIRRDVRIGMRFPAGVESLREILAVRLPAEAESLRVEWPCRGVRRGRYIFGGRRIACHSPLGLWDFRRAFEAGGEIRVYPDLSVERRRLAGFFLTRGGTGLHTHRMVGKGREFEKLREYVPGDGYDEIHWKATAKRGRPITKVFQVERTQEVYVLIDASRLSGRASADGAETMLDRFIKAGLVLCQAAQRQGDLFGLATFSDQVRNFLPARNGSAHFGLARDALYTLEPESVTPDYAEAFRFIRSRLNRRALLVVFTCLDDPVLAEAFTEHIDLMTRRHLVLVDMPRTPGMEPLFNREPEPGEPIDLHRLLAGHLSWRRVQEVEHALRVRGATFHLLDDERLANETVAQYLSVKQRQAL